MRKPLPPCFVLLCTLACAACAGSPVAARRSPAVTLDGQRISVEIAADDASREHGLMDRTSMSADHGMLFAFADSQVRTFWMKNTLIPLDMLFFDAHRRLVTLHADVPPCKADPCAIYPSTAPARYVLELNAGMAAKLGVRDGDTIGFDNISTAAQ